ncbi:hypothetical protein MTO98_02950 [Mucilaginibacter sp. SMC90]|uniref:hypothetical protein n=1 Tax=Mucilaginibacter sp. SMC90 TaxID=2929803 RepID=UPI001FB3D297|nr:hypothetical protein [Mucilaginibacter sp. SMC90]UOE50028.1 hypothetical protein MTO98_02950 [Mucilaginibacter sp. SMC90]
MVETNLIKQKFKSAIRRGTGETHLLIQNHPQIDFSGEIIKACVKNFAYDGQCEDSRGKYLFELINLSGREGKIKQGVLKALLKPQKDTWTLTQLFDLAKMFAQQGDTEARQVIYDAYVHNPIWGSDWAGTSEITELDGIEGLKFIAEEFGKRLEKNPEDWQDDDLINKFQKENPEVDVWTQLDISAEQNRFIKIYTDAVRENIVRNSERVKTPEPVYKNIVEEVLLKQSRTWFFNGKLKRPELDSIAQQLLTERKKSNIEKLLRIFTRHKFPLDQKMLFDLARKDPVKNRRIVTSAIKALNLFKSKKIRQFALEQITIGKHPTFFVELLIENYKKGDHKLLSLLVADSNKAVELEGLIIDITNIYHTNKTSDCREPLEALYDKHSCSICRKIAVKILKENNALSERIKNEIRFDCNEDTRELYE